MSVKAKRKKISGVVKALRKMSVINDEELASFYRRLSSAFKDYKKKERFGAGPLFKKGEWVQVGGKKKTTKPMVGQIFDCVNPKENNGEYKYRILTVDPITKKLSKSPHGVSVVEHRIKPSIAGRVLYDEKE